MRSSYNSKKVRLLRLGGLVRSLRISYSRRGALRGLQLRQLGQRRGLSRPKNEPKNNRPFGLNNNSKKVLKKLKRPQKRL